VALFDWFNETRYILDFFFLNDHSVRGRKQMASLVLHLLTVSLGVAFLFFGHLKLTPQFFPDYHNYVKNEFGKLNKEFPFHRQTGWRPYAKNYRITLGITEVACGFLLLLGKDFI
jgi:uncharacterized membrane protein YphA (DoxX/SURF4 family)